MSISEANQSTNHTDSRCVLVCQHLSCVKNGSEQVLAAFRASSLSNVFIEASACQGQCNIGPTVRVLPEEIWYYRIKPSDVAIIVEQHLQNGQPVEHLLNPRIHQRFDY